tara:strand:- start:227 stop:442 length:216 start_codon:yes stop_codon:yes gene_type:complete
MILRDELPKGCDQKSQNRMIKFFYSRDQPKNSGQAHIDFGTSIFANPRSPFASIVAIKPPEPHRKRFGKGS